jgi:hypothetical protein
MLSAKRLTFHIGALLAAWLVIDVAPAQGQFQAGFTHGGSTTFTPSGNGVRWPVTLVPTPGRLLGVSNMMLVPTPGTPPYANLNPPYSSMQGSGFVSSGYNLGGFGSVLGGGLDYNGLPRNPSVEGVLGGPATGPPYGIPIGGVPEAVPIAPNAPYSESAPAEIPYVGNEMGVTIGASSPLTGYLGFGGGGPATLYYSTSSSSSAQSAPTGLQAEVQNILNRSSRLDSVNTIQVAADRGTLVLRGIVKDDHERRLAEAIARLTPGVHELRNELAVRRTN